MTEYFVHFLDVLTIRMDSQLWWLLLC